MSQSILRRSYMFTALLALAAFAVAFLATALTVRADTWYGNQQCVAYGN